MTLFVVSDIHGHATLLKDALRSAGYAPENENHLLICCGDVFDRGSENYEVLKFFERIERKVMLKGNHEERLLEILDTGCIKRHDFLNKTDVTIREFFGNRSVLGIYEPLDFSGNTSTVNRLYAFIGDMRDYYETQHYVFVHGWLPNAHGAVLSDWRNASRGQWYDARWTHWTDGCEMERRETKTIVCGHYPTADGAIYRGSGFIAIDAGTAFRKRVNVLVLEDECL